MPNCSAFWRAGSQFFQIPPQVSGKGRQFCTCGIRKPLEDDRGYPDRPNRRVQTLLISDIKIPAHSATTENRALAAAPQRQAPIKTCPATDIPARLLCVQTVFRLVPTTDWAPSITSAVTSSPRCAGKQCMNKALLAATCIISASTCQSANFCLRSPVYLPNPCWSRRRWSPDGTTRSLHQVGKYFQMVTAIITHLQFKALGRLTMQLKPTTFCCLQPGARNVVTITDPGHHPLSIGPRCSMKVNTSAMIWHG